MAENNTLNEWSDGEDDWIFDINENNMPGEDDRIRDTDSDLWEWSDPEADDIIRNMNVDDIIRNMNVDDSEWSDPEADDMIRNMNVDDSEWSDPEADDVIRDIQTGRGEKRKSDEPLVPEKDFYEMESVRKHHSKKFGMTATDHIIRFNTVLSELDLIESYERTQAIFQHLLNDVTRGMNEKDQVRFVLRSDQLDLPISIPFMPLARLTTERVFSQIERVIQSNRDFRLNDTVTVDIIRVEEPQGGTSNGISKRTTLNIREYLKEKKSVITINNDDNLCLARALVVAVARIEKDPKYNQIRRTKGHIQFQRALDLHQAANVPLGLCGLDEVDMFQKYLTNYEITIVSGDHDDSIIYPPNPGDKQPIYLYYHAKHFDVITKMPGFLSVCYFCHKCRKTYSKTTDHVCPAMCTSCRSFDCVFEEWIDCNECSRKFKSRACYAHHKEPVGAGRSVCQTIRKCEKCGKVTDVRKMKNGHMCGKKCKTCGIILKEEDGEHKCYIQKLEQPEESQYNHLLFFDFEATQEHGVHEPNLCVVHDEVGGSGTI